MLSHIEKLETLLGLCSEISKINLLSKKIEKNPYTRKLKERLSDIEQIKKLKNSKIEGFFKTVTNSEMVGVKKPNPKIFNFALKAANAKAHQSVMIGDSIEADIEGAEGVGMQTVFFDSKDEIGTYSKLKINKLEQLKQLL